MSGIHHVTAISGDSASNLNFYKRDLGLRFVKKTVNFDDPSSYHFYYGDATGSPGTILTFFVWPGAKAGSPGGGEVHQTAFRVPLSSLDYWTKRLTERGISRQRGVASGYKGQNEKRLIHQWRLTDTLSATAAHQSFSERRKSPKGCQNALPSVRGALAPSGHSVQERIGPCRRGVGRN
jgi:catechol 2,3-dioxygenase-like lactoylglutathione lyase family enzyme